MKDVIPELQGLGTHIADDQTPITQTPETEAEEVHGSKAAKPKPLWLIWVVGPLLVGGLLYGVFMALPNRGTETDFSRFKSESFEGLQVLPQPPPQPVVPFAKADGSQTSLGAFHGKVILVNLWATWCTPCVTEMPTLANLQRKLGGDDFEVVAISVDREDNRTEAVAKLNALSAGALSFYQDTKMGVVFPMKARGFPTSVLYDRNGNELARYAGEADWAGPEAMGMIEAAIASK